MKARAKTSQQVPLDIAAGDEFGRYPKISVQQSFNMFPDGNNFLVPFAGYKFVLDLGGQGRGIFVSTRANLIFVVSANALYSISPNLGKTFLGNIGTITGDVSMAEDLQKNIAICDKANIYLFNWGTNTLTLAYTDAVGNPLNFQPTYITMQDGRFIATDTQKSQWRLSNPLQNNQNFPSGGSVNPPGAAFTGAFQTKPDAPIAAVNFPARGNTLLLIGSNHSEVWYDVGAQLFPYQKNTSYNIDWGTVNPFTIAFLDNLVAWVGINERTGPVIIFSNGQDAQQISNDGINFKLATLVDPESAYGFMFRQDGHLFYVATFYNTNDNFSIAYDFTTKQFITLTDEFMNYFVAKNTVFFNNTYYFISINDGNLYEINSQYYTYQYQNRVEEIPRVRVCKTFRTSDGTPFITNSIAFPIEQGIDPEIVQPTFPPPTIDAFVQQDGVSVLREENQNLTFNIYVLAEQFNNQTVPNYQPAVDMAISLDGGETFGSFARMNMNPLGFRKNRFVYYGLGYANEMTVQLRFFGMQRFVATNGVMNIYG